jgi:3D (Asp-Asp-Asp) domain-containing protein
MSSSPENSRRKPVLLTGALIAASSLAIVTSENQPVDDQKILSESPNVIQIDQSTAESPTLTYLPGSHTQPDYVEAAYITSDNETKKPRKRRLIGGLGGVANTGFSRAEVKKAQALGHTSSSFKHHPFYVTTYGPPWNAMEGTGITSTGLDLEGPDNSHGKKRHVVAVDPSVIPYGTLVTVWPNTLHYRGAFLAADTGSAIDGSHVDVYNWTGSQRTNSFSAHGAKVRPYNGIPAGGR